MISFWLRLKCETQRRNQTSAIGAEAQTPELKALQPWVALKWATWSAFGAFALVSVYAGWGLSQDFYREGVYRSALDAPDLDAFIRTDWEDGFSQCQAANLYAQAMTWFHGDISADPRYGGDLAKALNAIQARVLLMPGETDLYFRVADNAAELPHLRHAELRPIPSIWGHRAGNPATNPADFAFLRAAVHEWLE